MEPAEKNRKTNRLRELLLKYRMPHYRGFQDDTRAWLTMRELRIWLRSRSWLARNIPYAERMEIKSLYDQLRDEYLLKKG